MEIKKKKEKHNPESITSVLRPVLFKTHVPSPTALWLLENMTVTSMVWVCGLYWKKKLKKGPFFGTADFGYWWKEKRWHICTNPLCFGRVGTVLHEAPSYVLFFCRSIHTIALQHREYHTETTASNTTENVSTPMQAIIPLDYQWKKAFMKSII